MKSKIPKHNLNHASMQTTVSNSLTHSDSYTQTPPTLKDREQFAYYVKGDIEVCLSKDIKNSLKRLRDYLKVFLEPEQVYEVLSVIDNEIMGDFENDDYR
jgi:hypothetical protein